MSKSFIKFMMDKNKQLLIENARLNEKLDKIGQVLKRYWGVEQDDRAREISHILAEHQSTPAPVAELPDLKKYREMRRQLRASTKRNVDLQAKHDALLAQFEALRFAICKYPTTEIPLIYKELFPATGHHLREVRAETERQNEVGDDQ